VDFQRVPENVHGLEFQSSDWRQMSNIEIENQKFGFVFDHRWESKALYFFLKKTPPKNNF